VFNLLLEGVITLIITAAIFYVAPGVMNSIATAAPKVYGAGYNASTAAAAGGTYNPALATVSTAIDATAAGSLNLASIGLIMLGIAIMIGGFMLIRGGGKEV
jgi:hypothetical protein